MHEYKKEKTNGAWNKHTKPISPRTLIGKNLIAQMFCSLLMGYGDLCIGENIYSTKFLCSTKVGLGKVFIQLKFHAYDIRDDNG